MQADVLVAGGGSAGLAAAVSAARTGARTLLIEQGGCLGGMAPAALVHSICGLYRLPVAEAPAVLANPGFATEFAGKLMAAGGASGPMRMGRVDVLLQQPAAFARLADQLVREEPDLEVRLHTQLIGVGPDFSWVEIACRRARERLSAGAIVDATGDGAAAALGGAAFAQEAAAHLQRPAFIYALGGVQNGATCDEARLKLAQRIVAAVRAKRLPEGALGAAIRATGRAGEAYVTIDLAGGAAYDPTDTACLTRLEMEGRELAEAFTAFLRREVEGFSASFISAFPTRIGVRESRRIVGQQQITGEDLLTGASSPDGIALATWPMELRETNAGPRLRYPQAGEPCQIPLGALRARDHERLFMAGRCIACSHEAQASLRVIGTCFATGEAAGIAAALFATGRPVNAAAVRQMREKIAR